MGVQILTCRSLACTFNLELSKCKMVNFMGLIIPDIISHPVMLFTIIGITLVTVLGAGSRPSEVSPINRTLSPTE